MEDPPDEASAVAAFVTDDWPQLSRVAFLLTQDAPSATALLERAVRTTPTSPSADQRARFRQTLISAFLTKRRRPFRRDRSGDPNTSSNNDDPTLGRFNSLSRLQRAVIVLRFYEEMDPEQAAVAIATKADVAEQLTANALTRLNLDDEGARAWLADRATQALEPTVAPFAIFAVYRQRAWMTRASVVGIAAAAVIGVAIVAIPTNGTQGHRYVTAFLSSPGGFPGDVQYGAGLPQYADGMKLLTQVTMATGQATASGRFVPTGWGLSINEDAACPPDRPSNGVVKVQLLINNHDVDDESCSDSNGALFGLAADPNGGPVWQQYGVALGKSSTLTVRVTVSHGATLATPVGAIGVYQTIPRADYPVPTAPPILLPSNPDGKILLDSRHVGDDGTWTLTATVGDEVNIVAAAPGSLIIEDGTQQLADVERYDYGFDETPLIPDSRNCPCDSAGNSRAPVELTVHASSFTDAGWYITEHALQQ